MAWARLDDAFDDHPKVLSLLDTDGGIAAIGLWTLCLAWANRNTRKAGKTPGLLPASLPRRYLGAEGKSVAALLVEVGLWDAADDGGWSIHDFGEYLPGDETRAARSAAGKKGAAKRWADKKQAEAAASDGNLPSSDSNLPSAGHDAAGNVIAIDGSRAGAHRVTPYGVTPVPTPTPEPEELSSPTSSPDAEPGNREDIERVCAHLADCIEKNGSKRPGIGKTWRDAARLLMDADGRSERQVHNMIDWCQDDEWWRSRIMSMPKLREKYDALRLQALPAQAKSTGTGGPALARSTTDDRAAQAQALKAEFANQSPPTIRGEIAR